MDSADDVVLLRHYYERSNPFSPLRVEHSLGPLVSYCSASMRHSVYYSVKNEAAVIAVQSGSMLTCLDLFYEEDKSLSMLVSELADGHAYQAILGSIPNEDRLDEYEKIEGENILFVYDQEEDLLKGRKLMFPLLACV